MALEPPFPELDEFLAAIGAAGQRVSELAASEGAAGNISICIGWPFEVRRRFPLVEPFELPLPAPALAGRCVIVSGSGRRLRDIHVDPAVNLGVVAIGGDGRSGQLYTSPRRLFARVTSEFNSHLAVHNDQIERSGTNFHALIHAQPPHLTYLSHIPAYRKQEYISRRLLRWEPETIVNLPEGIGVLPYRLPGSPAMMEANLQGLRDYRIVLWSKHGVMARSDQSVTKAADRIEYAETAALYEYMDLVNGSQAEGLTQEELREVVQTFDVPTTLV
ncbi:rhamnulose-1-phosphate aldolase [Kouleothrix aurantiaca]|uniref:Rhamnulose-1-phosphate aldolase n=1 Tax=Kouleothrix aurantiaca TaxID=186479 RepID=A0A0P9D4E7_9CHLR|nr:rhamnulose-1-phosphate aldolase [Kouleothrix aurantiaca]